jgi:hypothetical protein
MKMKMISEIFNLYEPPADVRIGDDVVRIAKKGGEIKAGERCGKKMKGVASFIESDRSFHRHVELAVYISLALMLVGAFTTLMLFWPALIMHIWLLGKRENIRHALERRFGFLDGMMYTLINVNEEVNEMSDTIDEQPKKGNQQGSTTIS